MKCKSSFLCGPSAPTSHLHMKDACPDCISGLNEQSKPAPIKALSQGVQASMTDSSWGNNASPSISEKHKKNLSELLPQDGAPQAGRCAMYEEKFSKAFLILCLGQSKQGWDHQSQLLASRAEGLGTAFHFIVLLLPTTLGSGLFSYVFFILACL